MALGEHRAGRLSEAAAAYRQILAIRPNIAEVQNNLGIILCQQGRLDEALPGSTGRWPSTHAWPTPLQSGQRAQRSGSARRGRGAVSQGGRLPAGLCRGVQQSGQRAAEQGKLDQAAARFKRSLAMRPDYAEAYSNLGDILRSKASSTRPGFGSSRPWRWIHAIPKPTTTWAWCSGTKASGQAKRRFEQAIALRPAYPEAHNNLGNLLWDQGELGPAAASFERAIALRPDYSDAHNNLGILSGIKESSTMPRPACSTRSRCDRTMPRPITTWASFCGTKARSTGPARSTSKRLALRPDYPDAQCGLASCYLVRGDFERGWPAYESRLRLPGRQSRSEPAAVDGPAAGRPPAAAVWPSKAWGIRCNSSAMPGCCKARGAHIVLAVPPALGRLLASHPDIDELFVSVRPRTCRRSIFIFRCSAPRALLGTDRGDDSPRHSLSLGRSRIDGALAAGAGSNRGLQDRDRLAGLAGISRRPLAFDSRWPSLLRWPACPACS